MLYFATETKNKQVMKQVYIETIYHDGRVAGLGLAFSSRKKAMEHIEAVAEERDGKISEDGLSTTYSCYFPWATARIKVEMVKYNVL